MFGAPDAPTQAASAFVCREISFSQAEICNRFSDNTGCGTQPGCTLALIFESDSDAETDLGSAPETIYEGTGATGIDLDALIGELDAELASDLLNDACIGNGCECPGPLRRAAAVVESSMCWCMAGV